MGFNLAFKGLKCWPVKQLTAGHWQIQVHVAAFPLKGSWHPKEHRLVSDLWKVVRLSLLPSPTETK
jgi:hypothetical protein